MYNSFRLVKMLNFFLFLLLLTSGVNSWRWFQQCSTPQNSAVVVYGHTGDSDNILHEFLCLPLRQLLWLSWWIMYYTAVVTLFLILFILFVLVSMAELLHVWCIPVTKQHARCVSFTFGVYQLKRIKTNIADITWHLNGCNANIKTANGPVPWIFVEL